MWEVTGIFNIIKFLMKRGKRLEIYDFFVMHRTTFYWIIKRKPNIHALMLGGGHVISKLALEVGQSFLCQRDRVGHVFFINHISKCSAPPSHFLASP